MESTFGVYKQCKQTVSSTIGLLSNSYALGSNVEDFPLYGINNNDVMHYIDA